ncbi:hypothetical protein AAG906_013533 [Vitis piasezkii]
MQPLLVNLQENQPPKTVPKDMIQFLKGTINERAKEIDSWGIVMEMKSIPEGFQLSSTFGLESALEPNLWPMESDKEFHATFWNYFIIGKSFILLTFSLFF